MSTKGFVFAAIALAFTGTACSTPAARPAASGATVAEKARGPLSLEIDATPAGDGVIDVVAHLEMRGTLPAEPEISIKLPAGAELVEGLLRETIARAATPATLERRWKIRTTRGPIQVTVRAVGAASGVTAQASWPSTPSVRRPTDREDEPVAVPPVRVHGVTLDEAISLTPADSSR